MKFFWKCRFITSTRRINEVSLQHIESVCGDALEIFQLKLRLSHKWAPVMELLEDSEVFTKIPGRMNSPCQ